MKTYKKYEAQEIQYAGKGKTKYSYDGTELFVEELAIKVYESEGFKAQWTENDFWWEIMCLLFWDVIFAKVRGAVSIRKSGYDYELDPDDDEYDYYFEQTVIQMNGMPHDFFSEDFYSRRKQIIVNRINELKASDIVSKLVMSYEKNKGKNCRPIENWNKYSNENLIEPLQYIEKNKVLEICHRLLKNFNTYRSGLPDLFVYSESEYFFSEVKSKNDRLSESQINWHNFISENLDLKIELFLVNHTDRQISNLESNKTKGPEIIVKITFGNSTSKKREDAIDFISKQPTFIKEGEGKDTQFSAQFSTAEINSLYNILDLTSGWKSQKIEIGGEIVHSRVLRNSLWCYRQKSIEKAGTEWCKKSDHQDNGKNPFNCKQIYFHQFESGSWNEFGYIDTDLGEWVFDKESIKNKLDEEIDKLKYCPLLNPQKIYSIVDKLPDRINPKVNLEWAFKTQNYETWIWHNGKWISHWGNKNFPSFTMITGIEKFIKKERNEIIKEQSSGYDGSSKTITIDLSGSQKAKKQSSGCFIATTVYGYYDHPNVLLLGKFRDKYLLRKKLGKFFVITYYKIGPIFSHLIKDKTKTKNFIRNLLDMFVIKIDKKLNL